MIGDAEDAIKEKTSTKAARLEDAADGKGDLEKTETVKSEDEATLSDTLGECKAKSAEFEKNQVTRSEEIKAIEQAMEILASPEVSGNAEKHLPTLLQLRKKSALLQVMSAPSSASNDAAQAKV